MLTTSTLPTSAEIAEDAALARAEWDETFDAAFDLVAGPDDCSDAFLSHVSEAYYTDARQPEEWSNEEMAEAYRSLAISLRADDIDRERDTLYAVCMERAEWLASAPETVTPEVEANAAETFALAGFESAATFAVYARQPHERFDPRRNEVVADDLTRDAADEIAARLRADVPEMVYNVSAAPLAVQMARAAARLSKSRRTLSTKGTARRANLETYPATVGDSAAFPALSRRDAIEADEADLFAHVSACGSRFDVRRKLAESVDFSLRRGGASLAVPSKLKGTAGLQDRVGVLAGIVEAWDGGGSVYVPTVLHVLPEGFEHGPGVAVLAAPNGTREGATLVGFLQDKHARWLSPLLNPTAAGTVTEDRTPVRVFVTAVTGGSEEKPTRGVNVVIAGAAEAVRQMWAEAERAEREERAYASGNRAEIEALLD